MNKKPSKRARENEKLAQEIGRVYQASKKRYGSPRVYQQLRREGFLCGKSKVEKLMKKMGLKANRQKSYQRRTETKHGRLRAQNLVMRNFRRTKMNEVWAGDITYLWTKKGWVYLAVVMDLYSRKVIGWSMKDNIRDELVKDSFEMAIENRGGEIPEIYHSDQGSQYSAQSFQNELIARGVKGSMSSKGCCYDNAVVESFFKNLKSELIYGMRFETKEQVKSEVFEYIEIFYNRKRLHSTLGYMNPEEFEVTNCMN